MRQKILITSALPYANGMLHFGHMAGAYLPADCYARFERLRGKDVLYICGTDEYGVAITLSAELAQRTPKEHVDFYYKLITQLFQKLNISFDHFSRTTWKGHEEVVQQFFNDLLDNGYIEARDTDQLYSEADRRFLADRYVIGICPRCGFEEARGDECGKCGASYEATDLIQPRSKITGAPLVLKKTRHWFLLFDRFKDKLLHFLNAVPWKPNVLHFARHYVEEIRPRAITRDLDWGVRVPLKEAKGKVFYVWFDAPIGYISATKDWAEKSGDKDAWKKYWLDPQTKYVEFMGKDNIPFHAVFFPAMIMGQNQPYKRVDDLVANEFYNLEGRQFSKSEGWTIDMDEALNRYHVDQIRYMIAATLPETGDSEFTWKEFQMRCNGELVGKFGNFVNRVLVFAQNHCQGKIPSQGKLDEVDERFLNEQKRLLEEIRDRYSEFRVRRASQIVMEIAQAGNVYFDFKTPWKDAKDEKSRPTMETTIALCLECIKALAIASYPIIPETANKIWKLLGFKRSIEQENWDEALKSPLKPNTKLAQPEILFQKIEDEMIEQEMQKLQELHSHATLKKEMVITPLKPSITIDDFRKLDLRVGIITKAEKVAKSKKLLQLEVDIGLERRGLVSGISLHYTPEQLIGKKVIVVANLEPAKIMGIESRGMVLAGSIDNALELVTIQELPAGAEIS